MTHVHPLGDRLHHRIPFRLVQRQPIGPMPPRDHQAVPRRHRIGVCQATARPAAFAAALGASVNPIPLPWSRADAPPSLGSRHGSPPRFLQARIGRKSNRGAHGVHSDGLRSLSLSSTASLREGCAYAEAFGYAAHKAVGTLFEAGNAVAGEALQQHLSLLLCFPFYRCWIGRWLGCSGHPMGPVCTDWPCWALFSSVWPLIFRWPSA